MGSTNYGNQTVSLQFFAPGEAQNVNKRHLGIRPRGIYAGGYLTRVSDSQVSVSPLIVEIGDNHHQVRVATADPQTIIVSSATPFIVLRWGYAESPTNYMDMFALALGDIQVNDIIVGKCVYAGPTLTSFSYSMRDGADAFELFLRVEPTDPASMRVRIRAGRVNYGIANLDVEEQLSDIIAAPTVGSRIDVIYVDSDGLVKRFVGTEGSLTPPVYNNKKVLAEISLVPLQTAITASDIKDVRSWI